MRRLLALLAVLALTPATAAARDASVSASVVPLVADSTRPVAAATTGGRATQRFTLVGVHWRGRGSVLFRTRSVEGRWNDWRQAAPEEHDGPDRGSAELRERAGWRVGNPWWVGPSDRIETRAVGAVSEIRAFTVWSPELRIPIRRLAAPSQPAIVPRLSWGANEAIRRAPPAYAPSVRFAIVHHTAGRNGYTRAEASAIVRGIQLYHVQGNGWNDIGYNFLVDRFGTIYEGRHGGLDRNVVGAHAQGFNTGSVGIALLGTYGGGAPSSAALDAIARLLAWRLDLAHVDPTGLLTAISGGNERYGSGVPVPLRAVSGHRDTGFTECPGNALYARLDALATTARRTGLPKIFDPRTEENDAGVRFTARLSGQAAWSVVVRDAAGTEAARGTGSGVSVDWTWETTTASPGRFTWTISAGAARPATGSVETSGEAVLAIQELASDATAISPNGDGQRDTALLTYRLTAPANVSIVVQDTLGAASATIVDRVWTRAGVHTVTVDVPSLPDGRYDVVVTARRADGAEVEGRVPLAVTRTLGTVAVSPTVLSPNGDGRNDRLEVTFTLAAPASVRVRVERDGRGVAGLLSSDLQAGLQRLHWNGIRAGGRIRDGAYAVVVEARDGVGRVVQPVPFTSDTTPPRLRIVPGRRLAIEVSEPALLVVRVNGAVIRRQVARAGVVRIPWSRPILRVRANAMDGAGNVGVPVVWRAPGSPRGGQ